MINISLMVTMKAVSNFVHFLMIALLVREGLGAAQTDPPSGSVIADFEGTANVASLVCNITSNMNNEQGITVWSIANFRGVSAVTGLLLDTAPELFEFGGDPIPTSPNFTYLNRLTILQLTSELDKAIIYCGTGQDPEQANFILRIYRPPILIDNFMVRVLEDSRDFPIDISQDPTAFPTDTVSSEWTRNGQPVSSGPGLSLTYSTVTFSSVNRQDSGNYSVFASNVVEGREVGNDTGSFSLDVIYGPTFRMQGPARRYVRLNNTLSLVCGYGLESNPDAVVTWTAPDQTTIMDNARYDLEDGPEVVRLNFTHTILGDNGVWRCEVVVMSPQHVLSGGRLLELDSTIIGEVITVDIQLTVIATPGPPDALSVDSTEATSILICWQAPNDADSPISFYTISARDVDGENAVILRNTSTNATFYNVTDLLPGTTYELTVVAVSQGGDIFAESQPSDPRNGTTGFTAPAPTCTNIQSADGTITVTWSYVHRGGLPLTSVTVVYRFEEGLAMSLPTNVEIDNVEVTTATVMNLVAGRLYTFTITAENSNGSTSIDCGPVSHNVGIPAAPLFGELRSGPDPGQVTIQIKTIASGVSDPATQRFEFVIVPVFDGTRGNEMRFLLPNYQNNMFETIMIGDLIPGQSYTFSATAVSNLGMSAPENSAPVRAAGTRPPTQPPSVPPQTSGNSVGAAVGGAIGGIAVVALIVLIVIVIILLFVRRGKAYHPKEAEDVRYQLAPTSESNTKVKEVPIDIGEDMGDKRKEDTEIQYAELDTFRPPSQQKNNAPKETKPVEPEEPVEYAVITTFKKKENESAPAVIETSAVPDPTPDTTTSEGDADKTGTSTTLV